MPLSLPRWVMPLFGAKGFSDFCQVHRVEWFQRKILTGLGHKWYRNEPTSSLIGKQIEGPAHCTGPVAQTAEFTA
jgi:hypothetical protein